MPGGRKPGVKLEHAGEWKRPFLAALGKMPNVLRAAKMAGVTRAMAYKERDSDPEFAEAWDDAVGDAIENIEAITLQLAKRTDYRYNQVRLAVLRAYKPERWGDKSEVKLKGSKEEPVVVETQNDSTDRIAAILSVLAEAGGLASGAAGAGQAEDDEVHAGDDVGEASRLPPAI